MSDGHLKLDFSQRYLILESKICSQLVQYVIKKKIFLSPKGSQSQKKQKLSGQPDFCRQNFPDDVRKLRQFSNLRQMPGRGVFARS